MLTGVWGVYVNTSKDVQESTHYIQIVCNIFFFVTQYIVFQHQSNTVIQVSLDEGTQYLISDYINSIMAEEGRTASKTGHQGGRRNQRTSFTAKQVSPM